jgi:hypothetical protein
MKAILTTAVLVLALGAPMGCATMQVGRTQIVEVTSTPSEATVRVDSEPVLHKTPASVVLKRKNSHVLVIEKDGYKPKVIVLESKASKDMFRNIIFIHPVFWAGGAIIDMASGSGYELNGDTLIGDTLHVQLIPVGGK